MTTVYRIDELRSGGAAHEPVSKFNSVPQQGYRDCLCSTVRCACDPAETDCSQPLDRVPAGGVGVRRDQGRGTLAFLAVPDVQPGDGEARAHLAAPLRGYP